MNKFMSRALELAQHALEKGEVPVGCVIVKDNEIIAEGMNEREQTNDVTAHAEIVAIREACSKLSNWRLDGCDIYVTLEPCEMCISAIKQSRMRRLYFGAYKKDEPNSNLEVYEGIGIKECENLLNRLFESL